MNFKGGKVEGIGDIRFVMECNNPKFSIDELFVQKGALLLTPTNGTA